MKQRKPAKPAASHTLRRIFLVDDHPLIQLGLTAALEVDPGMSVCGTAATAEQALESVGRLQPDLVIADLILPGKSGLELIKDLTSAHPSLPIVVLSMHDEQFYAERCLRAGARGYVMKSAGTEVLLTAVRRVLAGDFHFSSNIAARVLKTFAGERREAATGSHARLTDRELEIFQWIGRGESTQEIARRLRISPKTVECHRVHIKKKIGATTAAELTAHAARSLVADG